MNVKAKEIECRLKSPLTEVIGNTYALLSVRPYYEYSDGRKTEKQLGFAYEIVLLERAYEKIVVKIAGARQLPELVEIPVNGAQVHFDDLEASVYGKASGEYVNYHLALTAKSVKQKGGEKNA